MFCMTGTTSVRRSLQHYRDEVDLSVEDMALAMGCAENTVSNIEAGRTQGSTASSRNFIVLLCKALNAMRVDRGFPAIPLHELCPDLFGVDKGEGDE